MCEPGWTCGSSLSAGTPQTEGLQDGPVSGDVAQGGEGGEGGLEERRIDL